jgi:hypothetical protein
MRSGIYFCRDRLDLFTTSIEVNIWVFRSVFGSGFPQSFAGWDDVGAIVYAGGSLGGDCLGLPAPSLLPPRVSPRDSASGGISPNSLPRAKK